MAHKQIGLFNTPLDMWTVLNVFYAAQSYITELNLFLKFYNNFSAFYVMKIINITQIVCFMREIILLYHIHRFRCTFIYTHTHPQTHTHKIYTRPHIHLYINKLICS